MIDTKDAKFHGYSTCCNAPVRIAGEGKGDGNTLFFVCTACKNACDPAYIEMKKENPEPESLPEITKENFWESSDAVFHQCPIPQREPDYVSPAKSKYWYTEKGVIRQSDHWGYVAKCRWYFRFDNEALIDAGIDPLSFKSRRRKSSIPITGFCPYEKFQWIDNTNNY